MNKTEFYQQLFRNSHLKGSVSGPINKRAHELFERLLQVSEKRELAEAISRVGEKDITPLYKNLQTLDEYAILTAYAAHEAIKEGAARKGKPPKDFYLMVKQVRSIEYLPTHNLQAGTGSGKSISLIIAAAHDIIGMLNGTSKAKKGAVFIQVNNPVNLEQFLNNENHQWIVEKLTGGRSRLKDGQQYLEDLRESKNEGDVLDDLDKTNIVIIDKQSNGFLKQASRELDDEVTARLKKVIEYWDEGDEAFGRPMDFVGSHEDDKDNKGKTTQRREQMLKIYQRRFELAGELIRQGKIRVTQDLEEFRRLNSRTDVAVVYRDERNKQVMSNAGVLKLFKEDKLLREGKTTSKGRHISGEDPGHVSAVISVHLLDAGEVLRFHDITYDKGENRYIHVGKGQLKSSQIPPDGQLIYALNERRKELSADHSELLGQFAEDPKSLKGLDTSSGVANYELFRKEGGAFIRMASATQGEYDEVGRALLGAGVYDVERKKVIDAEDAGFSVAQWLKDKAKRGEWESVVTKDRSEQEKNLRRYILDFLDESKNPVRDSKGDEIEESSLLVHFGELDGKLREYARQVVIEAGHEDLVRDIDGSTNGDAKAVETIVKEVKDGRRIVFTDLVAARGNDFQAPMMIINTHQGLTPGEFAQIHGRGGRTNEKEGGLFPVYRVEFVHAPYLRAQIQDFMQMKNVLLEYLENKKGVEKEVVAVFQKAKTIDADAAVSGGLTDNELIIFRSTYNLISQKHKAMLQQWVGALNDMTVTAAVTAAIKAARDLRGTMRGQIEELRGHSIEGQLERLREFNDKLFEGEEGTSSVNDVHFSNRPLTPAEALEQAWKNGLNRAEQLYAEHLSDTGAFSPTVLAPLKAARDAVLKVKGKKLSQLEETSKALEPGKGAGSAADLSELAAMHKLFLTGLAPTNRTSQTPPERLAQVIQQKKEDYKKKIAELPLEKFQELSEEKKIEFILEDMLPLDEALYFFGDDDDDLKKRILIYSSAVGGYFYQMIGQILASRNAPDKDTKERAERAAEALNMFFFEQGYKFHIMVRVTGEGPTLLSTYRVVRDRGEVLAAAGKPMRRIAGHVLARIDGLPEEMEATIDAAHSLGNDKFERAFESKIEENLKSELLPKANGESIRHFDELERDLDILFAGGTTGMTYLNFTSEHRLEYNYRKHDLKFRDALAARRGRPGAPTIEDEKDGEKEARRIESMVGQLNSELEKAYASHKAEPGSLKAMKKALDKKRETIRGELEFHRDQFDAYFGTDPLWKVDMKKVLLEWYTDMLLSHEFTHELNSLTVNSEKYGSTSGFEKEYIAHQGPIAKDDTGKHAVLVFLQMYGYLSLAREQSCWRPGSDYG